MKIGNVEIENSLALGPMAGVTDLPFRLLCKEQGCGMLYTEMVSAKAILYKNKNTNILLNIDKAEHPIAVQLFGSDPDIMAEIGAKVADVLVILLILIWGARCLRLLTIMKVLICLRSLNLWKRFLQKWLRQ